MADRAEELAEQLCEKIFHRTIYLTDPLGDGVQEECPRQIAKAAKVIRTALAAERAEGHKAGVEEAARFLDAQAQQDANLIDNTGGLVGNIYTRGAFISASQALRRMAAAARPEDQT